MIFCWGKALIISFHSSPNSPSLSSLSFPLIISLLARHLHNTRVTHQPLPPPCLEQERRPTSAPLSEEYFRALLARAKSSSIKQALCIHSPIFKLGLHGHLLLNNRLLHLYSKCGGFGHARDLFDEMPHRDVASWTTIISSYARNGYDLEALGLFRTMLLLGSPSFPNEFTLCTVLCCASSLAALEFGAQLHAHVQKLGLGSNIVVGSALLDVYSKCGRLEEASRVFALMGDGRDAVSWTAMISALVEAGDWHGAMRLYASMIKSSTAPNEFTFAKLLMACGALGRLYGLPVHSQLILWGMELNLVLKTALVDMYSKCGLMRQAREVFRQTPASDVVLWTAMISGYAKVGDYREAVSSFQQMENAGVSPNSFTYAGILSICSSVPMPDLGRQFHCRAVKVGLEHHVSVGNALVDLYSKCFLDQEDLVRAFQAIASPNVVSWTALIAGLAQHGREQDALMAFAEMRVAGVEPNSFTLSTILKCCTSAEASAQARKLHAFVLKSKLDSTDIAVGNSLVDMYARFRRVDDAWAVASIMMPCRDVFTYTSLAKGLNQMGLHQKALDIVAHMHDEDVRMDSFSLACFLSAAAGLAAMDCGKQLHSYSVKCGLRSSISVSNGLVDMYSKCGMVDEARQVFMVIQDPNVVSWNGLISGLATNGRIWEALSSFEDMRLTGAQPDGVTFLLVLYACSHGGLVDAGIEYFNSMDKSYGVSPQQDHYVCLVDMLGRAGRLEEAACAIETMPFQPDVLIYKTVLASCKLHGNLILGECMARNALEMDPTDPAIYVMLAGIYDDAGKLEWGDQTRRMMRERAHRKFPGQSRMDMTISL